MVLAFPWMTGMNHNDQVFFPLRWSLTNIFSRLTWNYEPLDLIFPCRLGWQECALCLAIVWDGVFALELQSSPLTPGFNLALIITLKTFFPIIYSLPPLNHRSLLYLSQKLRRPWYTNCIWIYLCKYSGISSLENERTMSQSPPTCSHNQLSSCEWGQQEPDRLLLSWTNRNYWTAFFQQKKKILIGLFFECLKNWHMLNYTE
jgi:hypothetical protein